jgi:hypothetical protein
MPPPDHAPGEPLPAGTGGRIVSSGECIASIAFENGFFWETLWKLPENAELKKARKDPFVLIPGDRVHVPELRRKDADGATEKRHRFRRRGVPSRLRIRLLEEDEPIANKAYVLEIDDVARNGATDADGWVDESMSPGARRAVLRLEGGATYEFDLGGLDPVSTVTGVQARLKNLGFDCGKVDGIVGPRTKGAIRAFQARFALAENGDSDQATRAKLVEVHGC